ncbi:MAG: alpha/beta fold hydrolase [Byssovorax sp.]
MSKCLFVVSWLGLWLMTGVAFAAPPRSTLQTARAGFRTQAAATSYQADGPPEAPPPGGAFTLVKYRSPVGPLAAYVSRDPGDGKKHPAVLWAHGGFGGIGPDTLAQIEPFAREQIVVMCPSFRGENDNPGRFEMFYGEVDDALAALDHLSHLPYVDPYRIYVVGHSSGGTIALLLAESTAQPRAVFSLGGAPNVERVVAEGGYSQASPPFPRDRAKEAELRSPLNFLSAITVPTHYFEGARVFDQAADAVKMDIGAHRVGAPVTVDLIAGGDHFSIVNPLLSMIARKIAAGDDTLAPDEGHAAFVAARPRALLKHAPVDLSMSLGTNGEDICWALPEVDDHAPGCAGMTPGGARAATAKMTPAPSIILFVRFDRWTAMVSVASYPADVDFSDPKGADEFARGMASGAAKSAGKMKMYGDLAGTTFSRVVVDGRPALRSRFEVETAPGSPQEAFSQTITYVVPSDGQVVLLQFSGGPDYIPEIDRLARESVGTARLRLPRPAPAASTRAYALGKLIGELSIGLGGSLFVLVAVGVGIYLQRRKTPS